MPTVVGVKLKFAPKVLLFDAAGTTPEPGDTVIVETERGIELGQVLEGVHEVAVSDLPTPLKPVVRVATDEDLALAEELAEKERDAMGVYRELIGKYKLKMKPIDVEFLFGGEKVVFYFVAEERVDFRDLVRELASRMRARVDMRQVGVRDEARMVGGLGHCGQQLCCARFSGEFQPVSIRMAKEQDLPLNPLKISGLCGRLMCCLRYEFEAYKDFKSRAPKRGTPVETPLGDGKVAELNTPRETVRIRLAEGGSISVPLAVMQCERGCPCKVSREALDTLDDPRANSMLARLSTPSKVAAAVATAEAESPSGGDGRGDGGDAGKKDSSSRGSRRSKRRRGKGRGGSGEQKAQSGGEQKAPAAQGEGGGGQKAGAAGSSEQKGAGTGSSGRRRRRRRPPGKDKPAEGGSAS